ncbi:helix-hairpin-helix domain-containing protein [Dactylosporangium cerinum]
MSPQPPMTAWSRREVRALLARAAEVQADAEAIVDTVGAARAEVVEAYEIAREPQVWTALEQMSVETVKDTVDGRARLDELPAHGIRSVADVLRAGPARLIGVPGIGEGTARKTIHAAEQLKRAAQDSLQFRIEFDPKNPEMTRLVRALARFGMVWHAAGAHEADAGRLAEELAALRPVAAPAGVGPLRRLFMRAADRAVAEDAARRIGALLDTAVPQAARDLRALRTPTDRQAWRDFEQRSADYYGLLSQVVGLGGDVAASEGSCPRTSSSGSAPSSWTRPGSATTCDCAVTSPSVLVSRWYSGASSSATRWGSARRSRPSPRWRTWPRGAPPTFSSCARPVS